MAHWMNLGQHFKVNAKKYANKLVLKDQTRSFTYAETNRRVNRLAHCLMDLGLSKGDKVAVFMDNCIEIIEVYLATAKTGIIIVPINFRLVGREVEYIVNNSDAKAMIVEAQFAEIIDPIKKNLEKIAPQNYVIVGGESAGYLEYERFISGRPDKEPDVSVKPEDTWILIYTSGTTGKPKGVIRSHESHIAYYLINGLEMGFNDRDYCLNIMPLCHINSTFYTFIFLYLGGSVYVHPALSFKAPELLKIVEEEKITFISLIPTHYNLILNVDEGNRRRDVSSIRKLLCSSAPVRQKMKRAIMTFFPNAELYEGYGSTEAGCVTVLKPEDQISRAGSIGQETLGTDFVKILDFEGNEVATGEVGEIFSRGPMLFDEYYKLPEKTLESFKNGWFSAGDLGRKDEDGYYYIVDRKNNMIITGGENVYPSEVEEVVGSHECVFDCACIGLPDEKWGEKIVAVVALKDGVDEKDINEKDIQDCCRVKLASYKRPKEIIFIKSDEMPRTPTGKILHRKLKDRYLA
ncbi:MULTISPECIES: class I adenylate-forming enzyme family protein [Desulfococcus]|uniref:AMP-dependent synthetase and ligase n=1 Tax=Desulfococcus multivorans DSM 2059 TaxID=1121405 RepID=S7TN83_DESML|nr:class I adenylate-forming enzyme family protein [Desulfococcus multivorans]AOY59256.1 FadD4: long-chain-fatty-acid--CoA ligase [Desulfococcus multivorans]AQV01479.1 long-chain fatty acid--CoA ligase [Desulfococcus multivorans]EPR38637.1 AMP-dependent synthetase and ligase [Desulfococcus multivorans DSM 2059]SKA26696.1 Acyl-CoA synthetase (AMP-forming)/AMP-acid ligase II [Desulfococcus multivorans DSM 2059]